MMVSDHGFGPCLGRIHVNRILVKAGVARLPGWAGLIERRTLQVGDRLRLWGQKRDDPAARSASFDQSVTAQYPFDWKRTLAFAPHQDTAAMVYVNCAARHGGVKTSAPRMTPRQIDEARSAAATALAEAKHPETGSPLFPQIIETAAAYQIDPTREGYPDLIALPDEPYWVRTKLTSSASWVEPDPNLPGTHRPEGIVALAGAGLAPGRYLEGPPDRRHAHDPRPPGTSHPGPHRRQADRRHGRDTATKHPASPQRDTMPRSNCSKDLITSRSSIPPRSKRSSNSASPIWAIWSDRARPDWLAILSRSNPTGVEACATGCRPSRSPRSRTGGPTGGSRAPG